MEQQETLSWTSATQSGQSIRLADPHVKRSISLLRSNAEDRTLLNNLMRQRQAGYISEEKERNQFHGEPVEPRPHHAS